MMNRASKRWFPAFRLIFLMLCWGTGQVLADSQETPGADELSVSPQGIAFLLLGMVLGVALFFAGSLMYRKVTEGWHLRRLALEAEEKETRKNSEQKGKN